MGGLDASTLRLLRESPSAFVTQRNKAPEGFSPVLLLPWGLQDVGWCCILAVPGLIPFLFAELPALAAASQSSEQTARMVEGLGKHAWYFPSFPPPPPYQLFPSPPILPASASVICFCWRWAGVGGPRLHSRLLAEPQPVVCTYGRAARCTVPTTAPLGMAFTGGIPSLVGFFPSLHTL